MPKKTTKKQRGIQKGAVSKHKILSKPSGNGKTSTAIDIFFKLTISKESLIKLSLTFQRLIFTAVDKLCLLPIEVMGNGNYVVSTGWKLTCHKVLVAVCIAVVVHHSWATIHALTTKSDSFTRLVCFIFLEVQLGCLAVSTAVIFRPHETVHFLNIWKSVLTVIEEVNGVRNLGMIHDPIIAFYVILASLACVSGGIICALGTVVVKTEALVLWHSTVQYFDLIPLQAVPQIWLKLALFPIEILTNVVPLIAFTFSIIMCVVGLGGYKTFVNAIRSLPLQYGYDRRIIEQLYAMLEVYGKIACAWLKFVTAPTALLVGIFGVTIFYVVVRMTDLPVYIYAVSAYLAAANSIGLFMIPNEVIRVVRATEEILMRLKSHEAEDLRRFSRAMKIAVVKRATAMRPVAIPMGDFTEVSLSVPINIIEEQINQLLFLLNF